MPATVSHALSATTPRRLAQKREANRRWRANRSQEAKDRANAKLRAAYAQDSSATRKYQNEWYAKNGSRYREKYRAYSAAKYAADPEGMRAYARKWEEAKRRAEGVPVKVFNTPEQAKQKRRAEYVRWSKANPHMTAALAAARRARKVMATPKWANPAAIQVIYAEAARLSKDTGIAHEVDHYFPLKSDVVCGLHCEANLRVITAAENMAKGNKCP